MVDALASDPEADLWVAFAPQPEMFSRAVKVSDAGVEYAGGGGMTCAQPIGDIVAYRIGPDGETVGVRGVTVELVGETVGVEAPAVVSKAAGNSTSFVYSLTGSTSGVEAPAVVSKAAGNSTSFVYSLTGSTSGFGNFVGYNRPAGNSTSFVYSLTGSTSGFGNFVGYNRPADSVDDDEQ